MHVALIVALCWALFVAGGAVALRCSWGRWPVLWMFTLNFGVLQWLSLRLVQVSDGGKAHGYYLDSGMVPLTGWVTNYLRLWKKRRTPGGLLERAKVLAAAHRMDAPAGPMCRCGKASTHESGWCGTCELSEF